MIFQDVANIVFQALALLTALAPGFNHLIMTRRSHK